MKVWQFLVILVIVCILIVLPAFVGKGMVDTSLSTIPLVNSQSAMDGLSNSSWPMYAHDRRHTGMAPVNGPQTNNTKWIFQFGSNETGGWVKAPPAIGSDGTIYLIASEYTITNNQYRLYAINPDGTLKWKTEYILHGGSAPLISSEGTIYITGFDRLYSIDQNGSIKWEYDLPSKSGSDASPPVVGADGTLYVFKGDQYAFNPNGTVKWRKNSNLGSCGSYPAIGPDGILYYGSADYGGEFISNSFFAKYPNGTEKWQYDLGNGQFVTPPAIDSDGTIYFSSEGMGAVYFYALNPNGTEKWKTNFDGYPSQGVPPVISPDETICVSVQPDMIYAIDNSGKIKWIYQGLTQNAPQSPMICDNEGTLYFSSDYVYAISSNGTEKWKYKMNLIGVGISPVLGPDGTLYVTSETERCLYAIK